MKKIKEIKVKIFNSDSTYVAGILTKFHVRIIENRIDELSLSNDVKCKIIDEIIDTLKSSGKIN